MLFQLVQIVYWLALSTWFGSVMFIALAAPVIFSTVEESSPILTNVLSVNLEGQHGTLLAGSIVSNLIHRLMRLELFCGAALVVMLAIQPFVIDLSSNPASPLADNRLAAIVRTVLFLAAAGVALYDRLAVWPRIVSARQKYIDHADEPEVANPAKDEFDREQRRSVTLLMALAALLLGMILFSANVTPPGAGAVAAMPRAAG